MKNLFDPLLVEETKQRIMRLSPANERQWGSMGVAQTLAHCTSALEMAMGVIHAKRAPFPANVIGKLIKPLVLRDDKPMRRNSPSSPALFLANPAECNFEQERSRLIAAIDSFCTQDRTGQSRHPHPFFGPLKPEQWSILMYKHVDHHLRQFGV